MDVRELDNSHVGRRATVTFPESGTDDSFTGVVTSVSHIGDPAASSAIFKVAYQSFVVMSGGEVVTGPAVITFND